MRKSIIFLFLLLSGYCYAATLQVVSATPKGDFSGQRTPVSITFNQPVAPLSEKSAFTSANCPLQITPAIQGTCRFAGTQTLQFEPSENWPLATAYTVRLAAGFTSRVSKEKLAQDYMWTFNTARPEVYQITPSDQEQFIGLRPLIFVQTSQPVSLPSAQQAFHLTYQASATAQPTWWQRAKAYIWSEPLPTQNQTVEVPVTVRALTEQEYQEHFVFINKERVFVAQPKKDLPTNKAISVTVSTQLRGKQGNLGPEADFNSVFYTYPALDIAGANIEGCLPFNAHIDFTSPVRLADLMKHMTVSPASALAPLTEQELQTLGYQRYVPQEPNDTEKMSHPVHLPAGTGYFVMPLSFLRIDPKQPVTLTIDKDLTDIYGQKLGKTRSFTVQNTGYCPAVEFKGGMGVLESYLPLRHPIDVLNEKEVEVLAARFDKENFIPFAEKRIPYCQQADIQKANVQYNGKYPFHISTDKTKKTYLDLKKFNPTAHQSIIFSQVKVPSTYRKEGFCWIGATDNITDLGITLKTSQENTLVWVTSLQSGEPQANLNVELRDSSNHTLWTGSTDANGLAWAPGWKELNATRQDRWTRPVLYAFVSSAGGDGVLASKWNDGLEPWRFNIDYEYNPPEQTLKTALFTDRGVYRPGETVYIKAISRQLKKGQWTLPAAKQGVVSIYNSRGEEVKKQTVTYHQGAFDLSFNVPADAATGEWNVYFKPDQSQEDQTYSFRVEAVKQADFEVHLRALQDAYTGGQKAQFTTSADYLFGAPVTDSKVKWTVRRANDWFEPKGYEDYIFMPYFVLQEAKTEEGLLGSASGQLDAQGKFDFTVALPKVSRRQTIYAEASVQAPTGQQLFARTQLTLNPADFYLGAYRERWPAELGEEVKTNILALNLNGKRIGPVQVKAEITKEEYFSIRKNGLAGRLEWVNQRRSKKIATQNFTVDMNGYDMSFTPQEPGNYQVVLSAKDSQGRLVKGGFDVMVYGKGEAYWKQNDDDILPLKLEKEVYLPGDTARVLVQSPYETATALVSVEREGVLDSWITTVSSGADYIEVPVKAAYTPNVFVSVTVVQGRAAEAKYDKEGLDLAKPQGKTGYVQLVVSQQERELNTTVLPNKTNYRPGEEVTVKITTALQGKPVAADVTFMAVDEGVLALTGYQMPNLMKVFYSLLPLSVLTADNRVFLIGQRNFGEKGENRGGGGGLASKLGGADLRSHFQFTPYFNANVRTNAKGKAEVTFKLPDNLTTFRLMAVSATVKEFGAAQANIKVSKPIMLTAKMPRFARRGDEFECGAVIFNYEDEKGQITLSAQAKGALELTPRTQEVHVEKGAAQTVTWPCKAVQDGTATVEIYAQGSKASDALQTSLMVSEVEKKQTLALYSATENAEQQVLEKPSSVNEQVPSEVTLSMASTALLNLRGGMLYLLTYPYDCLEQKMSKILPVIAAQPLIKDFKLGDSAAYQQQTQSILSEIPSYQDASGGLAYWPAQQPDPYVTAYALDIAYQAKKAGYKVPEESLKKAAAWLKEMFNVRHSFAYPYTEAENQTARAYAVYVLALYDYKMDGQFANLYTRRNSLSVEANSYLLRAARLLKKGSDIEKNLAQELLNHIQYGAQTLHFEADEKQVWIHASAVKATARALEALLQAGDYVPNPYQAVRWLVEQLTAQGHWKNTVDNAAVLSALNMYYHIKEAQEPHFKAEVSVGKKIHVSQRFEGRSMQSKQEVWPFEQVYAGQEQSRVEVSKTGSGMLYYTLAQQYAPLAYAESVNAGFAVSRKITDLQGNPVKVLRSGERYQVTLKTITSSNYSFVVLEDFIPAGVELVNTALATESQLDIPNATDEQWGGYQHDEKYDDRIAIFANYLTAGEHTYTYLIQTMTAGTFSYPSVWASQMYDPAIFGHSATETLRIEP